ncbi:hypothetical protein KBB96_18860 [Luteolibacter ambystomatis]|uniref:Uncharacterized protein n=2 Tax=Luteolibacter ambystomatis TaxID=2824561 RepID=A0A975IZG9_9BACT|nr:hypothetical protein [Luteolibacter ambystomatis]QUE50908.1 hypothetical protein KBB96_18860 [Luteolibacter ambystomatis]
MRKETLLMGAGGLVVVVTGFYFLRPPATEVNSGSGVAADGHSAGRPKAAAATETQPRPLVGGKLVVVEGRVGPKASQGTVRLKRLDGALISAQELTIEEDGGVILMAPVTVVMENGGEAILREGSVTVDLDGLMKPSGGKFEVVRQPANHKGAPGKAPELPALPPLPEKRSE